MSARRRPEVVATLDGSRVELGTTLNTDDLADGKHTFTVVATDAAGASDEAIVDLHHDRRDPGRAAAGRACGRRDRRGHEPQARGHRERPAGGAAPGDLPAARRPPARPSWGARAPPTARCPAPATGAGSTGRPVRRSRRPTTSVRRVRADVGRAVPALRRPGEHACAVRRPSTSAGRVRVAADRVAVLSVWNVETQQWTEVASGARHRRRRHHARRPHPPRPDDRRRRRARRSSRPATRSTRCRARRTRRSRTRTTTTSRSPGSRTRSTCPRAARPVKHRVRRHLRSHDPVGCRRTLPSGRSSTRRTPATSSTTGRSPAGTSPWLAPSTQFASDKMASARRRLVPERRHTGQPRQQDRVEQRPVQRVLRTVALRRRRGQCVSTGEDGEGYYGGPWQTGGQPEPLRPGRGRRRRSCSSSTWATA